MEASVAQLHPPVAGDELEEEELETPAAPDPEDVAEAKPTPPMQVPLPGDFTTISDAFGGATPEFSEIRLLGGKMPIDGSFAKGTEIELVVRAKVTGVLGQDATDDWGRTTKTTRRHFARMVSVRRAS